MTVPCGYSVSAEFTTIDGSPWTVVEPNCQSVAGARRAAGRRRPPRRGPRRGRARSGAGRAGRSARRLDGPGSGPYSHAAMIPEQAVALAVGGGGTLEDRRGPPPSP